MFKLTSIGAAIIALVMLSGCAATPTDPTVMAAVDFTAEKSHPYAVSVKTCLLYTSDAADD